jgi:hypothetical protein
MAELGETLLGGRRGCAIAMGPLDEPYIAIVDRTGVRLAR